ncbi:uroporphyrin-III C-methyltransferase [Pyrobaculum islandicum DSM 4184]|uniref:uroporphyrinogen-III C-methyltransferase n=1 Tax=Pyrobaculum islandicum (strain DSM 4184 / JCM 9189 / GEO3) TaxID=384616 RepID=A1RQR6_PYRIL|nr:uroporphyrinogen-III C-methyltransferase [Pyrobaculum islandicum]ABL87298.1 uroporphyrin-III C-methyltransferase [Pyrobaculum islandicum DSM 4184]
MGRVYVVGAGPGDPELITVKGLRLLENADVVLHDRLVAPELLKRVKPGAVVIDVGKRPGGAGPTQAEINEILFKYAQLYNTVVRLHGGDPLVFGRGFEECEYLVARGVPCEFVPGVTSGFAAPARYYIPPVVRGTASSVALVTGREDPSKGLRQVNFRRLANAVDTIVIYMGASSAGEIAIELIEGGLSGETPVAVIKSAYFKDEEFYTTTLSRLGPVPNPSIIVVGRVVERGARLWEAARRLL